MKAEAEVKHVLSVVLNRAEVKHVILYSSQELPGLMFHR